MFEPPSSKPYFLLWAKKVDAEIARNLLLNFINERGHDEQCLKFLEKALEENDKD